jgi:hypothetical protein
MPRLDARKVVCGLACVVWAGASALSVTACGSGASGDTQTVTSEHSRPANWEVRPKAVKRTAKERKRHHHLVRVAFDQAREVERCLSRSGYNKMTRHSHGTPDGLGVAPVTRATRESYGGRLPVAETGLLADHGSYLVGIAPTRGTAQQYVVFEDGVTGFSERDHSRDGLVSLESRDDGGHLKIYAAERHTVASCAFSVPAASGQPKWVSRSGDWRPIVGAD